MKKLVLFALLIFSVSIVYSQTQKVLFYGYIEEGNVNTMFEKSKERPPSVDGVLVTISSNGEEISSFTNRKSGFYSIVLEAGKNYNVSFAKESFITKNFTIDASGIPDKEFESSFKLVTDIAMFPMMDVEEINTLSAAPVAKCKYSADKNKMVWDMDYAKIAFDHFLRITGAEENYTSQN